MRPNSPILAKMRKFRDISATCNGPRSERSRWSKSEVNKHTGLLLQTIKSSIQNNQARIPPSPPPKTCRCPLNINISSTTYHFIRVHSSNGVMEGKVNRFPARESKADCESAEGGGGSRNGPLTQHVSGSVSNSPSLSPFLSRAVLLFPHRPPRAPKIRLADGWTLKNALEKPLPAETLNGSTRLKWTKYYVTDTDPKIQIVTLEEEFFIH